MTTFILNIETETLDGETEFEAILSDAEGSIVGVGTDTLPADAVRAAVTRAAFNGALV